MNAVPPLWSLDSALALLTLTALEVVLGIDNIIFIAILSGRLPAEQQGRARIIGLGLAMVMRIILLFGIFYIMQLTTPLFTVQPLGALVGAGTAAERVPLSFSGRDLILILGGLFLIAKSTYEIHQLMEGTHERPGSSGPTASFAMVLAQIALLDMVFSLDSVITAVGMARRVEVMVTAVVIAILIMIIFAGAVSRFISRHPSMKTLALAFLVMIGVLLVADGLGQHLPRGYVYFAMAFSLSVEVVNLGAGVRRRHVGVS